MNSLTIDEIKERFEGSRVWEVLPHGRRDLGFRTITEINLEALLKSGESMFYEIESGPRKGSIGRFVLPDSVHKLYNVVTANDTRRDGALTLAFDGRNDVVFDGVVNGKSRPNLPDGKIRFDVPATVWSYKTKQKDKEVIPEFKDHFGKVIEVGQVVLLMVGRSGYQHMRFAKIKRISAAGTIWVDLMKTRENHRAETSRLGINPVDLIVLDGDIREKAMVARLSL